MLMPARVLRRPRVVAEELLQQRLRNGDAGDLRRLELEPADAVLAWSASPLAVTGSDPVR